MFVWADKDVSHVLEKGEGEEEKENGKKKGG